MDPLDEMMKLEERLAKAGCSQEDILSAYELRTMALQEEVDSVDSISDDEAEGEDEIAEQAILDEVNGDAD